jgi:hypothetical protein
MGPINICNTCGRIFSALEKDYHHCHSLKGCTISILEMVVSTPPLSQGGAYGRIYYVRKEGVEKVIPNVEIVVPFS